MTNTALVIDRKPPLLELLSEQFSEAELDRLLALDGEKVPWAVWDEALYGPVAGTKTCSTAARPGRSRGPRARSTR